jgi:UDP-glucose 4-epimerase
VPDVRKKSPSCSVGLAPVTWIVTGAAGYIGAHVIRRLQAANLRVVVFDDLSTGLVQRLPTGIPLVRGSLVDPSDVRRIFRDHIAEGVIHLAARKSVAESMRSPELYWQHNVVGLRTLLDEMVEAGVNRILFSSSAAVYGGRSAGGAIGEAAPAVPNNPYGASKFVGEKMIRDAADRGISSLVFRQFNVIGAGTHPAAADLGATNLAPAAFRALTGGPPLRIFGDDYPTPDGSAVRDYVHIDDVSRAYVRGVELLMRDSIDTQLVVNVGAGTGLSVYEFVNVVQEVTGRLMPTTRTVRRPGDPAVTVADVSLARHYFDWKAELGVADAVRSAWSAWSGQNIGVGPPEWLPSDGLV